MPSGGSPQFESKDIIVFSKFDGMNTQAARHDLPEGKAAWMENLQPIGPNDLICTPAAAAAVIANLTGETITVQFSFSFGSTTDYFICFTASGAGYAVVNPTGSITTFAPAGTFSTTPDCTQWGTERILIADGTAGYCTWDTHAFVKYGGVSPNFQITAGGSGYTSPIVAITGGTGAGATATATQTGGVITKITLTAPGTGYIAGDTLTVTITDGGPGAGATATGHVWPNVTPKPTTLAVFLGRVWLAQKNVITYTGTGATYAGVGYDDFIGGDASGSTTIQDPDLVHSITALRALNNYLFIVGDGSVKQIGNISVSGSSTLFTLVTLTSDQGTTFRTSIVSYNRLVLFANTVGVFAIFGSSVEKISDDMDGIFRKIDFTRAPVAAVSDISNIHCFLLLVKYEDPAGTRSLILAFMNKKWFVISQGNNLIYIVTALISGAFRTYGTSGSNITQLLADSDTAVDITLITSLTSHGAPMIGKRMGRYAIAQTVGGSSTLNIKLESERNPSQSINYAIGTSIDFVNGVGGGLTFTNQSGGALSFITNQAGFFYVHGNSGGVSGIYLGATLTGNVLNFTLNSMMIEYGFAAAFGTGQVAVGQS